MKIDLVATGSGVCFHHRLKNKVTLTAPPPAGTFGRFWIDNDWGCVGAVNAITQKMFVMALR